MNAQGGKYGNALQAALSTHSRHIVNLLLAKGADVNTQGGVYKNVVQATSYAGQKKITKLASAKTRAPGSSSFSQSFQGD